MEREIAALTDRVQSEGLWAFESKVRHIVEDLQAYRGPGSVDRDRVVEALTGFFVRCQTAQQLVVIHDETQSAQTLCEDLRTCQALDHLERQLPRASQGYGDAELEAMVQGLQEEMANTEQLQAKALDEAHAAWRDLYQQLQAGHRELQHAHAQAAEAGSVAERLSARLAEIEAVAYGGDATPTVGAGVLAAAPASPEQITSLQSALREAISEQVQMAQEVAMLEEKMIAARSRENTPAKPAGAGGLKLRFEGL